MRAPRPRPGQARLLTGLAITGGFLAVAALSQVWTPEPPSRMRLLLKLKPPGAAGLAGTDAYGRDIASMLMAGSWNSLTIAFTAVGLSLGLGVLLGGLAAARRGWAEEAILRGADVVLAFPAVLSAIMIAALTQPGRATATLAIGLFNVPVFARVTHAAARRVWAQPFCLAAEALGKAPWRITTDHVLPNIAGLLAVQATVQCGLAILVEAGLSFLGLSLPPPAPSWGRMLADAQTYLGQAPWMAIAPGLTIAAAVLGLNLLGDGLRDRFDPRAGGSR